ncbi:MAG: DUF6502 family protein [Pseudomonadota bacterium]
MTRSETFSRDNLRSSVLQFLVAFARPLIRSGLSAKEMCELVEAAFVHVATEELGVRNRPANVSKVAAVTGLSRKSIRQIRAQVSSQYSEPKVKPPVPVRLISHWRNSSNYRDSEGNPRVLAFKVDDDREKDFSDLVREISTDLSSSVLRDELFRAGCISVTENGERIELVKHFYARPDLQDRLATAITFSLRKHVETIDHNTDQGNERHLRFERVQYILDLDGDIDRDRVRQIVNAHLEQATIGIKVTLDALRTDNPEDASSSDELETTVRNTSGAYGVGLYYFTGKGD